MNFAGGEALVLSLPQGVAKLRSYFGPQEKSSKSVTLSALVHLSLIHI